MSNNNWRYFFIGGIGLCFLFYFLLLIRDPHPTISLTSYKRIRIGMRLEEVKQIMKIPPGNYGKGPIGACDDEEAVLWGKEPASIVSWFGYDHGIVVWLDEKDIVRGKRFLSFSRSYRPTP